MAKRRASVANPTPTKRRVAFKHPVSEERPIKEIVEQSPVNLRPAAKSILKTRSAVTGDAVGKTVQKKKVESVESLSESESHTDDESVIEMTREVFEQLCGAADIDPMALIEACFVAIGEDSPTERHADAAVADQLLAELAQDGITPMDLIQGAFQDELAELEKNIPQESDNESENSSVSGPSNGDDTPMTEDIEQESSSFSGIDLEAEANKIESEVASATEKLHAYVEKKAENLETDDQAKALIFEAVQHLLKEGVSIPALRVVIVESGFPIHIEDDGTILETSDVEESDEEGQSDDESEAEMLDLGSDDESNSDESLSGDGSDEEDLELVIPPVAEPTNEKLPEMDVDSDCPSELDSDSEEGDMTDEELIASLPNDRAVLKDLIEKLIAMTSKGADAALRGGKDRGTCLRHLHAVYSKYYGYNFNLASYFANLFGPQGAFNFFEANEQDRPCTIRVNSLKTRRKDLTQTLIARGCQIDTVGEWSKMGLLIKASSVPVGATPEYLAGHYMLQSPSSFLPCIALKPQPNERVLDMSAAPGGKTTFLAQMMKNSGVLIANDKSRTRANALVANLHRLGVRNCAVVNFDGRTLNKHINMKFDRVLLDAPCSGSGVVSKDPLVKVKRTVDDFHKISTIQRQMLMTAIDVCDHKSKTGGYIAYSTCSLSVEENEAVVQTILARRHVKIVDTGITFGAEGLVKYGNKRFNANMKLCRRITPHENNMDGFFICLLKKYDSGVKGERTEDDDEIIAAEEGDITSESDNEEEVNPELDI